MAGRVPTLFSLNGFGLRLHGRRDVASDGTYTTTRYLTALYIPLVPIDAYRVGRADEGLVLLGKADLGFIHGIWRTAAVAAVVLGIALGSWNAYYNTPERKIAREIAEARALESDASSALERDKLLSRYESILVAYKDLAPEVLEPGVEGFVRVGSTSFPAPLTPTSVDQVKRFVARFEALPPSIRSGRTAAPMTGQLEAWAAQLDGQTEEHMTGAIRILDDAVRLAALGDGDRIDRERSRLRRALAGLLAEDWPLDAVREYVESGRDTEAVQAVAELLGRCGDSPSVWLELAPEIERWKSACSTLGFDAKTLAIDVDARVAEARSRTARAEYRALLQSADENALRQELRLVPGDQEVAIAVVDLLRARGESAKALSLLKDVAEPGLLVPNARTTLAMLYMDADDLRMAEGLLDRHIRSRLPYFEAARQAYYVAVENAQHALVNQAINGNAPDLNKRTQGVSDERAQEIFSEWLNEELNADRELQRLRSEHARFGDVVSGALMLGMVKLRRASNMVGDERERVLGEAERAFLAIQSEASGTPDLHLGLGRVYHRLGKSEQGEQEFAAILAQDNASLKLAVVEAYRELGLQSRARDVCQKVYDEHDSPERDWAALRMALMAQNRDELETWLRRADPNDEFVKAELLSLEASKLVEQGKLDEASDKFALVSEYFERTASHSGASANNASLAMQRRYQCTGRLGDLQKALELMETALTTTPDNALVVGNSASVQSYLGWIQILDGFVQTRRLRLSAHDAAGLVDDLLEGAARTDVLEMARQQTGLRRGLELWKQYEVLAPSSLDAYEVMLDWLDRIEDLAGLEELRDRVLQADALDRTGRRAARADWLEGVADERRRNSLPLEIERLESSLEAVSLEGHPPTEAAILHLIGNAHYLLATIETDPKHAELSAKAFRRASETWDILESRTDLAEALVLQAILETVPESEAVSELWKQNSRRLRLTAFVARMLDDGEVPWSVIRANPHFVEAVTLLKTSPTTRPTLFDWVLARASADDAFEQKARGVFARRAVLLATEVRIALDPQDENAQTRLALFKEADRAVSR